MSASSIPFPYPDVEDIYARLLKQGSYLLPLARQGVQLADRVADARTTGSHAVTKLNAIRDEAAAASDPADSSGVASSSSSTPAPANLPSSEGPDTQQPNRVDQTLSDVFSLVSLFFLVVSSQPPFLRSRINLMLLDPADWQKPHICRRLLPAGEHAGTSAS